jgi:hypothetical protein
MSAVGSKVEVTSGLLHVRFASEIGHLVERAVGSPSAHKPTWAGRLIKVSRG